MKKSSVMVGSLSSPFHTQRYTCTLDPVDPAVYISDYEPRRGESPARRDAMLEYLRRYFERNDVQYQEPWSYWAPMILASAVVDFQQAQSEAATWEEMHERHSKMFGWGTRESDEN